MPVARTSQPSTSRARRSRPSLRRTRACRTAPGPGGAASTLDISTMEPRPRFASPFAFPSSSGRSASIWRTTARQVTACVRRLSSSVRSQPSSVTSWMRASPNRRPLPPATANRPSIRPKRSTAAATAESTAAERGGPPGPNQPGPSRRPLSARPRGPGRAPRSGTRRTRSHPPARTGGRRRPDPRRARDETRQAAESVGHGSRSVTGAAGTGQMMGSSAPLDSYAVASALLAASPSDFRQADRHHLRDEPGRDLAGREPDVPLPAT